MSIRACGHRQSVHKFGIGFVCAECGAPSYQELRSLAKAIDKVYDYQKLPATNPNLTQIDNILLLLRKESEGREDCLEGQAAVQIERLKGALQNIANAFPCQTSRDMRRVAAETLGLKVEK